MSKRLVIRVRGDAEAVAASTLRAGIAALRAELGVSPDFPAPVQAEAAAAAGERGHDISARSDRREIELVTIDPPGSLDLDQAMHLTRDGDGYLVHYAIADLNPFVAPGGALDAETHRRGQTLYGADSKIPLHPPVLSEGAGSLLPDQDRPAVLWTLGLDATGELVSTRVERALVRSRRRLDYPQVQADIDAGTADPAVALLAEIGPKRLALEAARGGVSLPLPDQEIVIDGEHWRLEYRDLLPAESWNAQISLLTGIAAARIMLDGGTGILRTLPPADPRDIARVRRTVTALGVPWPASMNYPQFVASLDESVPAHAAALVACTTTLRGSGYAVFDSAAGQAPPAHVDHSAIASPYAHVTAPLRRLADRYAAEICLALANDVPVPDWVRAALSALPEQMRSSGRLANAYERGIRDLVEAGLMSGRVGERFDGVITDLDDRDPRRGTISIAEPAVEAPISSSGPLPLGSEVTATLAGADPAARRVEFTLLT